MDFEALADLLTPEQVQKLIQMRSAPQRTQLVQHQLDSARQMQQSGPQHKGVFGAALGGISNIVGSGIGARREKAALGQLKDLADQQAQALQGLGPAMQANAARLRTRDDQMHGLKVRGMEQDLERGAMGLDDAKRAHAEATAPIAQPIRELLMSYGVKVPDGATNGQMRQFYGPMFDLIKEKMEQTGQDSRLDKQLTAQGNIETQRAEVAKREAATKGAGDLRKELQGRPEFKAFQEVSAAFSKVQRAAQSNTPAADMALIFSYMKMLDPASSVREGEYANAQNTTGIPGQILNMYNRARNGNFLNPEQRNHFVSEAQNAFGAHKAQFDALAGQYTGLAQKQGADPADVVLGGGQPPPPAAPATPDVMILNGKPHRRQPDGTYVPE